MKAPFALYLTLGASVALSLTFPAQASDGLSSEQAPQSRVANGAAAKECDFPPVAYVGGCTGTLVHPKVVVYAWHCGKPRQVTFSESSRGGFSVGVEKCVTNPRGSTNSRDWAYCLLREEITDIPIVPVVAGCEYEMISKAGQEVVQVGFGKTHNSGAGRKHWGKSRVTDVSGDVVTVGDENSVVACPGDSGGPLMVRMEDKSWRTIGILSTYNGQCGTGGVNWYADAHTAIKWIEEDSGIDITPCFDSEGNWEPGENCGGFYAGEPGDPQGNWGNKCEGTPVSGLSTTCGEQEGATDDEEEPEVSIKSPKSGASVESGKTVKVKVEASDNEEVKEVELFVDDDSVGKVDEEPYEFEVEDLKDGEHELKAVATDKAGNEGESKTIKFSVGESEDDDDKKGKGKKKEKDEDGDGDDEDGDDEDSGNGDDTDKDEDEDEDSGDKAGDEDGSDKNKSKGCRLTDKAPAGRYAALSLLGLLALRRRRRLNQ